MKINTPESIHNEMTVHSAFSPTLPASPKGHLSWTGLRGSSRGLALARAAENADGPLILLVPDSRSATLLEDEIRFFLTSDKLPVLHFPDWETLPYDLFSPHQDIISERLASLCRLPQLKRGILLVTVATAMLRLCPRSYLDANAFLLGVGEHLDISAFRQRLEAVGYRCVSQVMEHGEFAVRGSLIDLYPMGSEFPFRIDLFDDEVDSIRGFDPENQRSGDKLDNLQLLPAREFPLNEEGISDFRRRWRAAFSGDPMGHTVYREISTGVASAGIEYFLPLFFEHSESLFEYLPANSIVVGLEHSADATAVCWQELEERYEQRGHDKERPLLAPTGLALTVDEFEAVLSGFRRLDIRTTEANAEIEVQHFASRAPVRMPVDGRAEEPLALVHKFIDDFQGRILFVAESPGRREMLLESFLRARLPVQPTENWQQFAAADNTLGITVAPLEDGTVLEDPPLAIVTETQLFGDRAVQRRRRRRRERDAEGMVRNLGELHINDPVVHESHGVGRYHGLCTVEAGGSKGEFLSLEYAGGDRLYVPVQSLHLISRYTGCDPEHAPLHKLGSPQWARARKKAAERVCDVAAELLDIYAQRMARKGHRYQIETPLYEAFSNEFPFEETPDQQAAIDAVITDMEGERPMDRVACGDVGFGKTEVALRATFVAVQDSRQVAILVPTTLLAQQHYQNFCDRFADWPVRVELLSRFRSKKQQDAALEGLADGTVDIVIGTHKLLQKGINFKRLGLVVIDEEHRFGVRQKERLKALRAEVDVLTLTATPIPRTLNLALSGLRDLSLITTAPQHRLSIKTFVRPWDDALIREACLREIHRGGQIYFVHNRVEDIERIGEQLAALVPEASLRIGHGQMREKELEGVMMDFYHQRFNLLLCTTIVESGIDIPTANTIIINRADRFGLAQLHQLRGRVGRSHHRAYAFLLAPDRRALKADAVKRLDAIESMEDLGMGFTLASHDLEIRGAGELLGGEQSGQIQEIGYSLYTELMERAVAALKDGRHPELTQPLDHGPEVELGTPALIPEDYLPDVHARLVLYKRIAGANSAETLRDLQIEMIDRFGLLPDAARVLFRVTGLKLKSLPLGIQKMDLDNQGGYIQFADNAAIDPGKIVELIAREPEKYRFSGNNRLRLEIEQPEWEARAEMLEMLLDSLALREAA